MGIESVFADLLIKTRDLLAGNVELSKYILKFDIIDTLEALPYINTGGKQYGVVLLPFRREEAPAGLAGGKTFHENINFFFGIVGWIFLFDKTIGLVGKKKKAIRGLMQLEEDVTAPLRMNTLSTFLNEPLKILSSEYEGLEIGDGNLYQAFMLTITCMKELTFSNPNI